MKTIYCGGTLSFVDIVVFACLLLGLFCFQDPAALCVYVGLCMCRCFSSDTFIRLTYPSTFTVRLASKASTLGPYAGPRAYSSAACVNTTIYFIGIYIFLQLLSLYLASNPSTINFTVQLSLDSCKQCAGYYICYIAI